MDVDMSNPADDASEFNLVGLADRANETLETAVNEAAHQAFNLGCLIGLLPALLFAFITFLITGFSIIGAFVVVVLSITGTIAFANLAAMVTRRNTLKRVYRDIVEPEINRSLHRAGIARLQFDEAASLYLAPTALLAEFIQQTPPETVESLEEGIPYD